MKLRCVYSIFLGPAILCPGLVLAQFDPACTPEAFLAAHQDAQALAS